MNDPSPHTDDHATETARETYAKLHANTSGPTHQGQTSTEAQAALDEIDRLRHRVMMAEFFLDIERNNHEWTRQWLRRVDPTFVDHEHRVAEEDAYWNSPDGEAEKARLLAAIMVHSGLRS